MATERRGLGGFSCGRLRGRHSYDVCQRAIRSVHYRDDLSISTSETKLRLTPPFLQRLLSDFHDDRVGPVHGSAKTWIVALTCAARLLQGFDDIARHYFAWPASTMLQPRLCSTVRIAGAEQLHVYKDGGAWAMIVLKAAR